MTHNSINKRSIRKRNSCNQLCREVVELRIDEIDDVTITAEFSKKTKDTKKTVLEFIVKGDVSVEHSFELYKLAGDDVTLTIEKSSISTEFKQASKGVTGKINPDGTVDVDGNQMSFDERFRGPTGLTSDSTASIAIRNVDEPEMRHMFIDKVDRCVNRLPELQKKIIKLKYMQDEEIYDYQVYQIELGIAEGTFTKFKWKAFEKLAGNFI
ncbi:ArpU family phage packaging/lysis transcriptional regulator [Cohnella herbarum]|uniref:Uncharacterized protein n=1 Tax=Cohnella herbarum TaxID=2728023 RepID=A0A7Z2ZL59_9BACL|nr:ArpU family phage packaging/lysis transcriptional regulator [Cohnella herbarum]QJD83540.1 hypothetical protein HH215_10350 [Cohnella herbarum]